MQFKCKMCGGDLIAAEGATITECDSCGTRQTLPSAADEQKANLYNRANHYRRISEFDRAVTAYENILNLDANDAEAHWGLVLSRYGIEYVEDPIMHEQIPTCHRVQSESILADPDYKAATQNAPDGYSRELYESEAKRIAEIQRGILAIVANEEPYDVFICYKETTDGGTRTKDSSLAQDIYYQLTQAGYRVFFSRITLEDKIGREYEPYIFSALSSAKVMLVIGTQPEYFSAVWVKNEWSRFLALMKKDKSRLLIPCYRDMDAYDLPEEMSMLQSQDMGKIGFVQDLLRGIHKVLEAVNSSVPKTEEHAAAAAPGVESLYKRALLFLEDGEWKQANEYFDRILDIDPEYAPAYAGKLCAELTVKKEEHLENHKSVIIKNGNYQKALRFADADLKARLVGYNTAINARLTREENERKRKEAERQAEERREKERLAEEREAEAARRAEEEKRLAEEKCREDYEAAYKSTGAAKTAAELRAVAAAFGKLGEYQDSQSYAEKYGKLAAEAETQEKKRKIRIGAIAGAAVAVVIAAVVIVSGAIRQSQEEALQAQLAAQYEHAQELFAASDYNGAEAAFAELGYYEDAAVMVIEVAKQRIQAEEEATKQREEAERSAAYADAEQMLASGDYIGATKSFAALGDYNEARERQLDAARLLVNNRTVIAAGFHTVGLNVDGTAVAVGANFNGECDVSDWRDIVAVAAGPMHTVVLKADGTVVAVGGNFSGQCDVSDWRDIVSVAAGFDHTVGLKADGTVVAVGDNEYGQCDVSDWRDIVSVAAGASHTVGLKADGTLVVVGYDYNGQCEVSDWRDIVAVAAGGEHTVGLKVDGTVIAVGGDNSGQCDVSDWRDIIAVAAGDHHTIGLKADGTVVAVGYNKYGQCDVSDWRDIVAVSSRLYHTVGLKADGTVVAVGDNEYGQCDVSGWDLW